VAVHRTSDPVELEMLVDVLGSAGIGCRVLGTASAALIGVGQHVIEQRIEVNEPDLEQAGQLVAAFLREPVGGDPYREPADPAGVGADLSHDDEGADDEDDVADPCEDDPAVRPERPRSPFLAGLFVFTCFGGSHFYARRYYSGLVLACAQVASLLWLGWASPSRLWGAAAAVYFVALAGYDFTGGQLAVRAYNRGRRPGGLVQVALSASVILLLFGLAPVIARTLQYLPDPPSAAGSSTSTGGRTMKRPPAVPPPIRHLCGHPLSG
jgi:hypothetical protein